MAEPADWCCWALPGWVSPDLGQGPSGLSSSHFHLTVSNAALMSEGDNTWELKITIAST